MILRKDIGKGPFEVCGFFSLVFATKRPPASQYQGDEDIGRGAL